MENQNNSSWNPMGSNPNPNPQNNAGFATNGNVYTNPQNNTGFNTNVNSSPNPQNNAEFNPLKNSGTNINSNVNMNQQGYQQPYNQFPQKKGWDNKYLMYIGGAVVAVLVLFTIFNLNSNSYKTPSTEDPAIAASTSEYASEERSVAIPTSYTEKEDVEEEEQEETETSKTKESASESSNEGNSAERDINSLRENTPYEYPEYNGDTFVSHALGVKFEKPSGYDYTSEKELANGDGNNNEDFNQGLKEDVDGNKPRTEMLASDGMVNMVELRVYRNIGIKIMRYAGKGDDELIQSLVDIESKEENIEKQKEELKSSVEKVKDVNVEVSKDEFLGKPCLSRVSTITFDNNASCVEKRVIFVNNDFNGYITVLGITESDCDKLLSNFSLVEE